MQIKKFWGATPSPVVWAVLALCGSAHAQQVAYTGGGYGVVDLQGSADSGVTAEVRANSSFTSLSMNSFVTYQSGENSSAVTGLLRIDGAALGFTLRPTASRGLDATRTGMTAGSLYLTGGERVGLNLLGSLKNGAQQVLIRADALDPSTLSLFNRTSNRPWPVAEVAGVSLVSASLPGMDRLTDNSFVIDSSVDLVSCNTNKYCLTYTATRAQDAYVSKATGVAGHFSNNAALKLSRIAYEGVQSGDMATVIDRMDINDYGYGNTAANLATQSKRLAPIANNAYPMSTLSFNDAMLNVTDDRLQTLRGAVPGGVKSATGSVWAQGFGHLGRQSGFTHLSEFNTYDGFSTSLMGVTLGTDRPIEGGWVGGHLSMAAGNIRQQGFRSGDQATVNSAQLGVYGVQEYGPAYLQAGVAWGSHDIHGSRATAVGRVADDQLTMRTSDVRIGTGYRFRLADGKSVIAPFAGLQHVRLGQPARTETGAGDLSLAYEAKDYSRTRFQTGVRYNAESRWLGRTTYLNLMAAVSRDSGLDNMDVNAAYTGGTSIASGLGFVTPAAPLERTGFQLGAKTSIALSKTASLQFKLDYEHRRSYNAQGVQVKGVWLF